MRIMVTGANGLVGRRLVPRLVALDHRVAALDHLSHGPWGLEAAPGLDLHHCDLRDPGPVAAIIAAFSPQAVIHLAARHFIPQCERDPEETVAVNVVATGDLLSACPPECRFVLASTAAVYAPSASRHGEDDPVGPVDIYGQSKLAAEELVKHLQQTRSGEAAIVRIFNVVGDADRSARVLPEIIAALRSGERVLRLGNVDPKRDFVHVDDVVDGLVRIATLPFPAGSRFEVVNLGSGQEYSVREIVALMARLIGEPLSIETDHAKVRRNDRPHSCADNRRAREMFGWAPSLDLETMLRRLWEGAAPAPGRGRPSSPSGAERLHAQDA